MKKKDTRKGAFWKVQKTKTETWVEFADKLDQKTHTFFFAGLEKDDHIYFHKPHGRWGTLKMEEPFDLKVLRHSAGKCPTITIERIVDVDTFVETMREFLGDLL